MGGAETRGRWACAAVVYNIFPTLCPTPSSIHFGPPPKFLALRSAPGAIGTRGCSGSAVPGLLRSYRPTRGDGDPARSVRPAWSCVRYGHAATAERVLGRVCGTRWGEEGASEGRRGRVGGRGRPATGCRSLNGELYSPTCRLLALTTAHLYFIVHVVHDAHLARRTPSLPQSAEQREEDKCFLLHRCCRAHPGQGRVRSFLITTRPPPSCPRAQGWSVLPLPLRGRVHSLTAFPRFFLCIF